jgi:hypothetical protein
MSREPLRRRSPVLVNGCDRAPEPAGITARQVTGDDLQDLPDPVHVSTTAPDAAAPIPGIPQAVRWIAHEPAPELQSLFGLPWHQAGVLEPGDDTTAVRRQAGELRDPQWPERAQADRQPTQSVGANLDWPPTRHCPFESRT